MAIVSGDQNPAFTATGVFVGLKTMGVPTGVGAGVAPGIVNVVLATAEEPVLDAITLYVPGGNDGTVIITFTLPALVGVIEFATFVVPNVTLTREFSENPRI
jgi:hypothetical protein